MKALPNSLTLICLMLATCTNIAWVAAANPEKPRLHNAQLNVSPLTQGVGGILTIQTYVQVNGTC